MTRALADRGPDDEGYWADDGVVFGHRRLAILDLQGGQQPFTILRGEVAHTLVYNGELFGTRHVRDRLEAGGERFRSRSDTEVLLRSLLVEKDPGRALGSLAGMFAFGWWDPARRRLLLGRDRVGIKPLYYAPLSDGSLLFASSASSLMASSLISSEPDPAEVGSYLSFGYTVGPGTLFSGVKELLPGHMLEWHDGSAVVRRWWETDWCASFAGTEDDAAAELDDLLEAVVREHLEADVAVAAFLSGGLDSSAVVARAARADPSLQTMTVAFPEASFDESAVAGRTARHLGVAHEVVSMEAMKVDVAACQLIVEHLGQPFGDSSALPMLLISKAAASHAKVVLSGDGGDELFAGYNTFEWLRGIDRISQIPAGVRRAAAGPLEIAALLLKDNDRLRQLRRALTYASLDREERFLRLKATLGPDDLATLVPKWVNGVPGLDRQRDLLAAGSSLSDVRAFTRFLFETSLPGDMLRKVDSMSMAASVEVRVPLLDHRIVEFAHRLPDHMKVQGKVRKVLLRRVVGPDLPGEVLSAPKRGFSIPLRRSMTPELLEFAEDTAASPESRICSLLAPKDMRRLVEGVRNPEAIGRSRWSDYTVAHALWFFLQLETWCRRFGVDLEPPHQAYANPRRGRGSCP